MFERCIPLPFPSFQRCVALYSTSTLRHVVDTLKLLTRSIDTSRMRASSWEICQMTRAWAPWPAALDSFYKHCYREALRRNAPGFDDVAADCLAPRSYAPRDYETPLWMGWPRLHDVHRHRLLLFGRTEQIIQRINAYWPYESELMRREFLYDEGFPSAEHLYLASPGMLDSLANSLDRRGAPEVGPNPYDSYGWRVLSTEEAFIEYPTGKDDYYVS